MFNPAYTRQVQLLLNVLPLIQRDECFALKGGTAINLFVQDLPRLSVDIDLAYLPLVPREKALEEIANKLDMLAHEIRTRVRDCAVTLLPVAGVTGKLVVNASAASIKIEPNFVFRGAVHAAEMLPLCPYAQAEFERFMECRTLSAADLYGGKIAAALDRQHPRDLFDIHLMFERFGLSDAIRSTVVVYLAGHARPIAELLAPNEQPIENLYATQFAGMSREPTSIEMLIQARTRLVQELRDGLTENERLFLLSIKQGEPEWERLPFLHLEKLPALQWKLRNIRTMESGKHKQSTDTLKRILKL